MNSKYFLIFALRFLGCFAALYYGTEAFIGFTAEGGYYISFLDKYANYVDWLRSSILHSSAAFVKLIGHDVYLENKYVIRLISGEGVRMVYSCIGIGVMSFWVAFIFANAGSFLKKTLWITSGLMLLWLINVVRVSMILLMNSRGSKPPLGLDHHTWFNIAAYGLIFIMIYFFDRNSKKNLKRKTKLVSPNA